VFVARKSAREFPGLLASVAVPGFVSFVQNNRATANTNEIVTALNLGRSEATLRGAPVLVCSSSDGVSCSGEGDWSDGWVVLAPNDEVVRTWPARSAPGVLAGDVDQVQFQPRGSVAAGTTLRVRVPDCIGDQGRDVRVNVAGRVSVTRVDCG
jgi:type IV fimbrial biogenesis protein FimT